MGKKKLALLTAFLAVALCAAIIVGATFALFGTSKTREVTVTTGSVNISAQFDGLKLYSLNTQSTVAQPVEGTSFNAGGTAVLDEGNGSIALVKIVPGDKAEFTLTIRNTGTAVARYRIDYVANVTGVEGAEDELNYAIAPAEGEYTFGTWNTVALAAGETVTFTVSVELDKMAEQTFDDAGEAEDFITEASIEFTVYAGQANASDADLNAALGLNAGA